MKCSTPRPGFLIAIEGIDGAGKTTQCLRLQGLLERWQQPVIRTKEPTSGQWGQRLRDSALTGRLSWKEEMDCLLKDRREHVEELIRPGLNAGKVVITDRYYFSTMAYQGALGGNPLELMAVNEEFAPEPDLLVVLDLPPEVGLDRIRQRGDQANDFEKAATLEQARAIFLGIEKSYKVTLNALDPLEDIRDEIFRLYMRIAVQRIADSGMGPREQLNATLALFGAPPV